MFRIESLVPIVRIEDLGVVLRLGEELWIDKRDSLCLRELERLGKVRVSSGRRSRVTRPPPKARSVPSVRMSRPSADGMKNPPRSQEFTADQVRELISRAAAEGASMAVEKIAEKLGRAPAQEVQVSGNLERRIEEIVAQAVRTQAAQPSVVESPSWKPEDPVYVPSNIVKEGFPEMKAPEKTQEGGVGDAADALKTLRKKRKENVQG